MGLAAFAVRSFGKRRGSDIFDDQTVDDAFDEGLCVGKGEFESVVEVSSLVVAWIAGPSRTMDDTDESGGNGYVKSSWRPEP